MEKDKSVQIRMTESDKRVIERAAKALGMPVSAFMRAASLREAQAMKRGENAQDP